MYVVVVCMLLWAPVRGEGDDELYVGGRFGSFEENFFSFANLQVKGSGGASKDGSNLEWEEGDPSLYAPGDLYDMTVNDTQPDQMYVSGQFTANNTLSEIVVWALSLSLLIYFSHFICFLFDLSIACVVFFNFFRCPSLAVILNCHSPYPFFFISLRPFYPPPSINLFLRSQDSQLVSGIIVCDRGGCRPTSSSNAPHCTVIPAIALYGDALAVVCGGSDNSLVRGREREGE